MTTVATPIGPEPMKRLLACSLLLCLVLPSPACTDGGPPADDGGDPGRLVVLPVLYVPADVTVEAGDRDSALDLLAQHMQLAQDQYRAMLVSETFWFERGRSKILPAANPKSGAKTLMPCHKSDDGKLYVSSRCRSLVRRLKEDGVNLVVDPETLVVLDNP